MPGKLRNVKGVAPVFTLLIIEFTVSKDKIGYIDLDEINYGGFVMRKSLTFVLIAIFMGTTALVLHSADKKEVRRTKHLRARMMPHSDNMMPRGLIGLFEFADKLELTNPQLLQLRMFHQKQVERIKEFKHKRMSERNPFTADLKEEDVKKYAAEQAKMVETRILARFQMQQDLKKIFTPEQLNKLELMRKKDSKREGMPFFQHNDMGVSPMSHRMLRRRGMKPGDQPNCPAKDNDCMNESEKIEEIIELLEGDE